MPKVILSFLLLLLLLLAPWAEAQQNRTPYTANNTILVNMEGQTGTYDYTSDRLLVRYNKETRNLECLLPLSYLTAANDSTPLVMAHDVFFTSRFPEIYIQIEAPIDRINAGKRSPQTMNSRLFINIQGINKEIVTPVTFTPDRNTISFSSSFEVLLDDMRLTIPAKYVPMLTGRIVFTIHNARWADLRGAR
ncbi:hypothetical protein [Pontibacter roseus]|uniref:hypothetical protein n=1 Tax=Pontibacter roseus TaxID=336989 RepID=UPI0003605DD6|nr:hypothetical protein [Pontibacter roseus]